MHVIHLNQEGWESQSSLTDDKINPYVLLAFTFHSINQNLPDFFRRFIATNLSSSEYINFWMVWHKLNKISLNNLLHALHSLEEMSQEN